MSLWDLGVAEGGLAAAIVLGIAVHSAFPNAHIGVYFPGKKLCDSAFRTSLIRAIALRIGAGISFIACTITIFLIKNLSSSM